MMKYGRHLGELGARKMIQCKLCGTPLSCDEEIDDHRKNHHNWFKGELVKKI